MPNPSSGAPSSDPDPTELKAGHPPAVKVGNMRVTQRTHSTSSNHSDNGAESSSTGAAGGDNGSVPSACSFAPKTVAAANTAGVPESIANHPPNKAEEIKHMHEKSAPTHDYRGGHPNKPNMIQQPRK